MYWTWWFLVRWEVSKTHRTLILSIIIIVGLLLKMQNEHLLTFLSQEPKLCWQRKKRREEKEESFPPNCFINWINATELPKVRREPEVVGQWVGGSDWTGKWVRTFDLGRWIWTTSVSLLREQQELNQEILWSSRSGDALVCVVAMKYRKEWEL